MTYTLAEPATLLIDFEAQTDKATPINLAQHTYFNLDGVQEAQSILEHVIQINRQVHLSTGAYISDGKRSVMDLPAEVFPFMLFPGTPSSRVFLSGR